MTTVDDLLNYVQETPNNVNPRVFKMMANKLGSSGSESIIICYYGQFNDKNSSITIDDTNYGNVFEDVVNNNKVAFINCADDSNSRRIALIHKVWIDSVTNKYRVEAVDGSELYEGEGTANDNILLIFPE